MIGFRYFKADSSTYVIRSSRGQVKQKGKGLSFWYNSATTSIEAIPISVQEAPFIFTLQTSDFQEIRVQGQLSYRLSEPETIAALLNFTVKKNGQSYVSEDPLRLSDQVVRVLQTIVQTRVQSVTLREALTLNQTLVELIRESLAKRSSLNDLGICVVDVTIAAISPVPETARALEAEAREVILKEADDAIYARRKSAVEQERTIREAELQTELIVQEKEQEIEESRIENERAILRSRNATERERLEAEIDGESRRRQLVELKVENGRQEADAEAYATAVRMRAFAELPVENLRALALANMQPEQLMAMAFDSFAQNAGKIGELNIGPEVLSQIMKRAGQK